MKKNILIILCVSYLIPSFIYADATPRPAMKLSTGKKVLVSRYQEIMELLETLAADHPELLNDLYQLIITARKKTRCYAPEAKLEELESLIELLRGDRYFLWDRFGTLYPDVRYIITACCKQLEDGTLELIKQ